MTGGVPLPPLSERLRPLFPTFEAEGAAPLSS